MAEMSYLQRLRQYVGHDLLMSPGVSVVLLNSGGDILLGTHSTLRAWALPAGSMEIGESLLQTVKREVLEETGLCVVRAEPFGIYSDPRYNTVYPNGDQVHPITTLFHVLEWIGELRADGEEILELSFFPLDRLPPDSTIHPPHRKTIDDFIAYRQHGQFVLD